jgi:uncharacterized OsmC-like protein
MISTFPEFKLAIPPVVTRGVEGVGTLTTRLIIFNDDWSSISRLSCVPPTDYFASSLAGGSSVDLSFQSRDRNYKPLPPQPVFRRITSLIRAGIGGQRLSRGQPLGVAEACLFSWSAANSSPRVWYSSIPPLVLEALRQGKQKCSIQLGLQLVQTEDGYIVVVYTAADRCSCSATLRTSVSSVANIVCKQ